jgi:hypothetical protein
LQIVSDSECKGKHNFQIAKHFIPIFENILVVSSLLQLPSSQLLLSLTGLPAITNVARDSSSRTTVCFRIFFSPYFNRC